MAEPVWEVVGGADKGGILVREGRSITSSELPERLATGALVRQVELVGDRLSYELLSGAGPKVGWVSTKVKEKDLLVITDKRPPAKPVVACFYSGGCTADQGQRMLQGLVTRAKEEGFADVVVLDHVGEAGYDDCAVFDDYSERLLQRLDSCAEHCGRPVFVVGHSHGALGAYGLARRLGPRCLKLYVLARRPPSGGLLDEVWGVDSAPKLGEVDDASLLRRMLDAWPNRSLEAFRDRDPLPPMVRNILTVVRRQYGSPVVPCGSADASGLCGEAQAIVAPICAIAATEETARGETAEKMEGWADFTQAGFELQPVAATHMEILAKPLFDLLFRDMSSVC